MFALKAILHPSLDASLHSSPWPQIRKAFSRDFDEAGVRLLISYLEDAERAKLWTFYIEGDEVGEEWGEAAMSTIPLASYPARQLAYRLREALRRGEFSHLWTQKLSPCPWPKGDQIP